MGEDRRQQTEDRRKAKFCLLSPVFCLPWTVFCLFLVSGCGTAKDPSFYDQQEQALKDPFSYNPDPNKSGSTVTGDGDKDALKRDVDHVLNP